MAAKIVKKSKIMKLRYRIMYLARGAFISIMPFRPKGEICYFKAVLLFSRFSFVGLAALSSVEMTKAFNDGNFL